MAKITIKGDTSGEVDIVVPAVAGSTTYNLSTSGGNVLSDNDIGTTVQGYDADTAKLDTAQTWTATQTYGDNVKQQFGASSDLQIYHDGSNSYVTDSGTGNLKLNGNEVTIGSASDTDLGIDYRPSSSHQVRLYHGGNSVKLSTESTGIAVTGTCSATSFSGDGSALTGISSYSDSDALTLFNASGNAPVYACRAWVSFNGGTSPSAGTIQGSGNVSSVTDNATGQATINFTSTMPNADYAVAGICTGYSNYNSSLMVLGSANGSGNQQPTTKTTSAVRVHYGHSNTVVNTDIGYMTVAIFG